MYYREYHTNRHDSHVQGFVLQRQYKQLLLHCKFMM